MTTPNTPKTTTTAKTTTRKTTTTPATTAKTTTKAPATTTARTAPARTAKPAASRTATPKPTPAKTPAKAAPAKAPAKAAPAPAPAPVELPEYVIVERKRRFANVTTRVLDLKHPACPVAPVQLGDNPALQMTWAAECVDHDERGYYRRKDIAEANAADPWIFCSTCATAMGDYNPIKR